ncbi:MAG: transposase [Patescibacteria group bacterium]
MPARNSLKIQLPNTFYHVYNRGVEKRKIFLDKQDYSVFLSYLKTYLEPKDEKELLKIFASPQSSWKEKDHADKELRLKNYFRQLELVCYALMPNHFHFLIRQIDPSLNFFMSSLGTRYGMYFNKKYKRDGSLFQDVYKAVSVESEEQLLHLSRYIHLNPKSRPLPSSLPDYLGERNTGWIKKYHILDYFSKTNPENSYANFLSMSKNDSFIAKLMLDEN